MLERKARVYVADVDSETIMLAAEINDFADIPQPKQVWVEGWRDSTLRRLVVRDGSKFDTVHALVEGFEHVTGP